MTIDIRTTMVIINCFHAIKASPEFNNMNDRERTYVTRIITYIAFILFVVDNWITVICFLLILYSSITFAIDMMLSDYQGKHIINLCDLLINATSHNKPLLYK